MDNVFMDGNKLEEQYAMQVQDEPTEDKQEKSLEVLLQNIENIKRFKKLVDDTMVNHPPHYCKGGVECITALEAATVGLQGIEAVCTANAIKYLWRQKHKNGLEDLKKARFYLDYLIKHYEENQNE